jgi:hypothetical protein
MTNELVEKANKLLAEMKSLKSIITNAESQKCECIEFTFGNGSNRKSVCDDKFMIEQLRTIIIEENQKKLKQLELEFEQL